MHKFTYNEKERRLRQNPEEILSSIGVKKGMVFLDIGCNDGFFTIPAAKMVGKSGEVYGADIDPDAIASLGRKLEKENIKNVKLKVIGAEEYVPCLNCADIIFYGIVLHDFHDPLRVLRNAMQILKIGGKLVSHDWKKKETPMGPPIEIRLSEKETEDLLKKAGFSDLKVEDVSEYFYQITARKAE